MTSFSVENTLDEAICAACAIYESEVSDANRLKQVITQLVNNTRCGDISDEVVNALLVQLEAVLIGDGE